MRLHASATDMNLPAGYLAPAIALVGSVPAAAMIVLNGYWVGLGTFACVAVIAGALWYLFDGGAPDPVAAEH